MITMTVASMGRRLPSRPGENPPRGAISWPVGQHVVVATRWGACGARAAAAALAVAVLTGCGDVAPPSAASGDRPAGDAATEVTVTCTADTTAVDRAAVEVSTDGVHLTVVDESGRDLEVRAELRRAEEEHDSAAGPVYARHGDHVLSMLPGRYLLLCSEGDGPEHMLAPSETDEAVELEVLDPEGTWVPAVLDCGDGMAQSVISDFVGGAKGQEGDPVELVREQFAAWLEPGDQVRLAGYPEVAADRGAVVIVEREGRTVVIAGLSRGAGGAGWLNGGYDACTDL
jgi:hypothetical protein